MYSELTPRETDQNFVLPIAKRKIMFSPDECLEEGYYWFIPEIMEETALKKLELFYLRGKDSITQLTDIYPIVKYSSKNTDDLNGFIQSITVAVVSGKKASFDEKFMSKEEKISNHAVAYITDSFNVSTEIPDPQLCKLLYQKPSLTVTNEGVLLFYTPTKLFATLDCRQSNIIEVHEFAEVVGNNDITKIDSITVAENGATVIKFKTKNKKEEEHQLSIKFDFFCDCNVTVNIT